MKGVQYLIDENGERTAVVIDLRKLGELWEDFYDQAVAEARKNEPRESLNSVKKRIGRQSGLRANV
ncbi:MAG: hypothetical protein Q8Q12_17340 [bacterium]|nr:hypothetical protein [bacterium]